VTTAAAATAIAVKIFIVFMALSPVSRGAGIAPSWTWSSAQGDELCVAGHDPVDRFAASGRGTAASGEAKLA
jgi:hypothetical protein